MNIGLFVPTFNAQKELGSFLSAIEKAKSLFSRMLAIDSSSCDKTVQMLGEAGFEVRVIPGHEFDHGGTRQLGVEMLSDCEVIVFLTQDAVLTSPDSVTKLVAAFEDSKVAIAYGRQLPRPAARPIEAHARLFGYPATSRIKTRQSIPELGLRSAVVSNSFAAYRRSTLLELGGFPTGTLFGEDTLTGAKAILAGHAIAYVGEATVFHSHSYSLIQEFRRYFDNGAFYSREKWILETFGAAEGSGKALVLSEIKYLMKCAPWLLPKSAVTIFVKFFGYKVGSVSSRLPAKWNCHFSMNKAFWKREMNRIGSASS